MALIEPENTLSGNGKRVLLGEKTKAATPERFLCKGDGGQCGKTGSFYLKGFPGNKYCKNHSTKDMISNKKECHEGDCSKKPCFNFPDEKQGKYCAEHKLTDMVNVVSKKCARQGCSKRASFNKEGERRGLFCADHRMPNMIPVEKRICTVACCWKSANYGDPDSHRGQGVLSTKQKTWWTCAIQAPPNAGSVGAAHGHLLVFQGKGGRRPIVPSTSCRTWLTSITRRTRVRSAPLGSAAATAASAPAGHPPTPC
mmetsp:Transcript_40282/g.69448  ORF Transcript_40282/g.69448 Transcript_40282/m.69448 type:complete len:255 (+) Transcript_40282:366-1130(+)